MFGNKANDFATEKFNSIIGADTIVEGTLITKDTTRIEGHIKGNVNSKGTLIIGTKGKIEGDIQAVNVLLAGEIKGNMNVSEKIEASSSGKINGDIQAKSLIIDENATFRGRCTMNVKEYDNEAKHTAAQKE